MSSIAHLPLRSTTMGEAPRHRMLIILMLVVASIVFQIAAPDTPLARLGVALLLAATLVLILTISELPRVARIGLSVVLAAGLAVAGVDAILLRDGSEEVLRLAYVLLGVAAPVALVHGLARELIRRRGITARMIFAVITLYLLIGILFGLVYTALNELSEGGILVGDHADQPRDFLYFSFVTLTTTGYGDLAPITDLARAFAISEALIGQVYLVTVVALFVGNVGRRALERRGGPGA